jgi:type II secretory pathway component PulJ
MFMIFRINKILIQKRKGTISLVELLAAMIIASLIVVVAVRVYSRANSSARSLDNFIKRNDKPIGILQLIVQDVDRLATSGTDATLKFSNKFDSGYNICQMTIESKIYNKELEPETFEKVIWQSQYNHDANGLVLYRAHSGMMLEDKVINELDDQFTKWKDRQLFVPVCAELTHFKIEVPQDDVFDAFKKTSAQTTVQQTTTENFLNKWNKDDLPKSLRLSISFAPAEKLPTGGFEVPEEDIIFRTLAVDRIRKIPYKFVKKDFTLPDPNDYIEDANDTEDANDPNNTIETKKR